MYVCVFVLTLTFAPAAMLFTGCSLGCTDRHRQDICISHILCRLYTSYRQTAIAATTKHVQIKMKITIFVSLFFLFLVFRRKIWFHQTYTHFYFARTYISMYVCMGVCMFVSECIVVSSLMFMVCRHQYGSCLDAERIIRWAVKQSIVGLLLGVESDART